MIFSAYQLSTQQKWFGCETWWCHRVDQFVYPPSVVSVSLHYKISRIRVMVFNATFNNISVILLRPVLLAEETSVLGENHRPAASHWQTLSQNFVSSTPRLSGIRTLYEISTKTCWSNTKCKHHHHHLIEM